MFRAPHRWWLAWTPVTVVILLLSARVDATERQASGDDHRQQAFAQDERGRRMRVGFDPGSRLWLGSGYAPQTDLQGDGELGGGYLDTGVGYRHLLDFDDEGISWKLSHQVLASRVLLADAPLRFETTAYHGRFMRWTKDGRILLPTNPPQRFAFPLNIGFETRLGELRYEELEADGVAAELGVIQSEVLLGMWRLRRLRSYALMGFGPSYHMWLSEQPSRQQGVLTLEHVVAPFTAGSLAFRHESADGHHTFDSRAAASYRLRVNYGWSPAFEARASYEAILLAVNDLPLSAFAEARYRYAGDPAPGVGEHELRGLAGLRLSLPLDGHR